MVAGLIEGQKPTNVAFGGEGSRQVFVTLQDRGAVEYFETDQRGRECLLLRPK